MQNSSQAPHGLDLVIDFVNTLDIEEDTDALSTPSGLASWLAERRLLEPSSAGSPLSEADRAGAIRLREALRALMLENNGAARDDRAHGELERAARRGDLSVHFTDGGTIALGAARRGAAGALAEVLVPVANALGDGSWQRVKACRDPGCEWAFYDRSRNRSGVWCNMAVCGNRTKVRAYRERKPRAR
jgi:predicted RNA-binding Zn ribbon-like protein